MPSSSPSNALAVVAASTVALALSVGLVVAIYDFVEARSQADRAERVDSELAGQPELRAEIELTIGKVYASLGQHALARRHLQSVLDLPDGQPPVEIYLDAGAELSLIDIQESKLADADSRVSRFLNTVEKHLPESRQQWLNLLSTRGSIRSEQGRHDEAFAIYERILKVARDHLQVAVDRLVELVGEDFVRRIEAMEFLADAHDALGSPDLAADMREEAETLRVVGAE